MQRAEEGYRDLLGRLPAIVYTSEYGADARRRSYVSPGIETILGYSVSEWLADPGSGTPSYIPTTAPRPWSPSSAAT